MGLRVTKIHEDTIAHVLRHEPAKALHGLSDAPLVGRNDLAQVLGVHASRECGGANKVREHHCDLATLGGVPWGSGRYGGNGNLRRILLAAGEFSYRSQQLESMT
jgi:hypothetical protein